MTPAQIVGVDPSLTATGVAFEHCAETWSPPKGWTGVRRLDWYYAQFENLGCTPWHSPTDGANPPAIVAIEGYGFARASEGVGLGELGGVIRLALHHAGVPFVVVSPSSRAKYATGKGNANKNEVLMAACKRFGYGGTSNDEADAVVIRQMALAHYLPEAAVVVPESHRVALDKVDWPEVEG